MVISRGAVRRMDDTTQRTFQNRAELQEFCAVVLLKALPN